jgi:glycosyltransferase involved in cell wall biosynthesis
VFASLLKNRAGRYDATVVHQSSDSDSDSAERFARDSEATVVGVDAGFRRQSGATTIAEKIARAYQFRRSLGEMLAIAQVYDPDVVYSNQQHLDCRAATYIAKKLKRPQVIHLHYTVGYWLKRQPLERLLTCDHVVAISDFIAGEARRHGVSSDRITTIVNPAPTLSSAPVDARETVRRELGIPVDAVVIGNVSRLDSGKGHSDILAAFERIAAANSEAYLVIVGDGGLKSELEAQAASFEASDRVKFTGRRGDVPALHKAMDIFIHPSLQEPCGLAVMEASVSALPVIAYRDGATPEIVADGVTGLLAPVGDIAALATALAKLIGDEAERSRLGRNGQAKMARDFRPDEAGKALAEVFERVASHGR